MTNKVENKAVVPWRARFGQALAPRPWSEWTIGLIITVLATEPLQRLIKQIAGERVEDIWAVGICYGLAIASAIGLQLLARAWLANAFAKGWALFSASEAGTQRADLMTAMNALTDAAKDIPKLVSDTRSEFKQTAPQLEGAIVAAASGGLPLLVAIQHLRPKVGDELAQTFFNDHAVMAKQGCLLLTMSGYLQFLQTALKEEGSSLICVNKTLPLTWFAAISDSDDFLPGYTSLSCTYRQRITRITLTHRKEDLGSQFGTAISRLEDHSDEDWGVRWLLSLTLPLLATENMSLDREARDETVNLLLREIPRTADRLRQIARTIYPVDGPQSLARPVSPRTEIAALMNERPNDRTAVKDYLARVQHSPEKGHVWTDCINAAFGYLMGRRGSFWGARKTVINLINSKTLKEIVDPHSEAGVFNLRGQKVAFHAKGDLYAGVALRILDEPESIEDTLNNVVARADEAEPHSSTLGVFGRVP